MENDKEIIDLGTSKINEEHHVSSSIQPDTLFTFVPKLEFLINYIKNSCLYPRYCEEDISYLNIPNLKKIYIPMKCFCDINLHRIGIHLDWYGHYGLAFEKNWGMKKGLQSIQYINPNSNLCKDFSESFSSAMKSVPSKVSYLENLMKSYMLHELMYYKPYQGEFKNRTSGKTDIKCFTDECEWRYVPNMNGTGFPQVYYDESIIANSSTMFKINDSLMKLPNIALKFSFSDIKYIIIEEESDFKKLIDEIKKLNLETIEEAKLISKIMVWENSKEDF